MCNVRTSPLVAIVLSSCLLTSMAYADTLILKNGATFEGRVVKRNANQIVFQTDTGVITFQARQVRMIKAKPWSPAVTLKQKSSKSPKATPRKGRLLQLKRKSKPKVRPVKARPRRVRRVSGG